MLLLLFLTFLTFLTSLYHRFSIILRDSGWFNFNWRNNLVLLLFRRNYFSAWVLVYLFLRYFWWLFLLIFLMIFLLVSENNIFLIHQLLIYFALSGVHLLDIILRFNIWLILYYLNDLMLWYHIFLSIKFSFFFDLYLTLYKFSWNLLTFLNIYHLLFKQNFFDNRIIISLCFSFF